MATIKFDLRSKSEFSPIYLRLTLGRGKQFNRKTSLSINPKDWSASTHLPKQTNPTNKNLTSELRKLQIHVLDNLNVATTENTEINGDWLTFQIDLFFGRASLSKESELVVDCIMHIYNSAEYRDNGKQGIGLSKSRANAYKRLGELFKTFRENRSLKIKELNKSVFDNFKKWLLEEQKFSPTYAYKKISDLKTVCKDAKIRGIEVSHDLDGVKMKQISAYDDDMDVITLTLEDIHKIESTPLIREAHINARKWLILACFTGQRGGALTERIKESNFEKYGAELVIKITQKKGNKPVMIPVLPKVKEIYEEGLPYPISPQKLNIYFKEIGKIAGIDEMVMGRIRNPETNRGEKKIRPKYEYISTHIGRRTFATNHYGELPTPIIMRVTGHQKESTFLKYIKQSDDSHIDAFLNLYKTKELQERKETHLTVLKQKSI